MGSDGQETTFCSHQFYTTTQFVSFGRYKPENTVSANAMGQFLRKTKNTFQINEQH